MHYELSSHYLEKISEVEDRSGVSVDKEKLYLFRTLLQITSSNTVAAMASWEFANRETQRVTGVRVSVNDLIDNLPENTIVNPINYAYAQNAFVSSCIAKYPTLIPANLKDLIISLSGMDVISLLSCGLRNVQVVGLIQSHNNTLEINRMFAQEIINSLCILCESTLKDYPQILTTIPRKKDRQIGKMLSPTTLGLINVNVSNILGSSTSGYTGLYASEQIMDDTGFNTYFPLFINKLFSINLTLDEFKAHVLMAVHSLRNKVLHDFDETLCFYTNTDLFIKTIGLLFVGVSVTKNI
jgi:hypothetical protein